MYRYQLMLTQRVALRVCHCIRISTDCTTVSMHPPALIVHVFECSHTLAVPCLCEGAIAASSVRLTLSLY